MTITMDNTIHRSIKTSDANEAALVFKLAFPGGANIVTPSVEEYGKIADGVYYEIGVGRSFSNKAQAGVSVVRMYENSVKPKKDLELSKLLTADSYQSVIEAARLYVAGLRDKLA